MLISAVRDDLCLNYANTLSWRGSEAPAEALRTLADLLDWIERSAGVNAAATQEIASWARDHQAAAGEMFAEAVAMREIIFRIFSAVAAGEPVREPDFVALETALAATPARSRLARSAGGYAWNIDELAPSMPHLLTPVLWSAADLMLNAGRRRMRQCANAKCLWLFLDESKSGTRRWCDMASCGNRAKAQRHYSRIRQR